MKKHKLIGLGSSGNRNFYIFQKESSFIYLFPVFLKSLGFKNTGVYEDYKEDKKNKPDIKTMNNFVEHFKNEKYDIDLIYTLDKIILIIRGSSTNRENLVSAIKKISDYI
jgi:hypothetical protein